MAEDDKNSETPLEDLPSLRSQRRFLEVMSLASVIYYWFDIQFRAEGSLFGQPIHIGSTRYTLLALWIGLIWAAFRYSQQVYRASHDLKKDLSEDFKWELSRLANRVILRYLSRTPEERRRLGNEKSKPDFKGFADMERFNFERARRFDTQHKEVDPELPSGPLAAKSHSVIRTTFDWMYEDSGHQVDYDFGIGRVQAAWLRIRAAIAAAFRRPAVFDYVTPVLLFLFGLLSLFLATRYGPATPVCV